MTQCKFVCQSVTKRKHWDRNETRFLFEAEFTAVSSGSEENRKFFEATPSGSIKIGVYREDIFEPGKEYYLDIRDAGN